MWWHTALREMWATEFEDPRHRTRFLILLSFLMTFGLVRLVTYAIRYHWVAFLRNISTPGGIHIHHMVFGIALLLISGYLAIVVHNETWRTWLALLFGIGAALTLDEFALWLNLADVYWERAGRLSVDAAVVVGSALLLAWIGLGFWLGVWRLCLRVVLRRPRPAPPVSLKQPRLPRQPDTLDDPDQ